MNTWNNIVNAALIGTGKKKVQAADFYEAVTPLLETNTDADNETIFLQGLALSSVYRRSGNEPVDMTTAEFSSCPTDTLNECSDRASVLLQTLISDKAYSLVHFWLDCCKQKNLRVPYRVIPDLLDLANEKTTLRKPVLDTCETTAGWLAELNPVWSYARSLPAESAWTHGKAEERLAYLQQLRENNPEEALEKLKATWEHETEAVKKSLLQVLEINLSIKDVPWLETLVPAEKSPIRKVVYSFLRKFQGTSLLDKYIAVTKPYFKISHKSGLLKLGDKIIIDIYPPAIKDAEIFESGIPKKSKEKDITDAQAIFESLIENIPPSLWANDVGISHEALLNALESNKSHKRLIERMFQAALYLHDMEWLRAYSHFRKDSFLAPLVDVLPEAEKMAYCLNHFDGNENAALEKMKTIRQQLSLDDARKVLRYTSKNPYQIKRDFYNDFIWQLPEEIRFELGAFGPDNNNAGYYWNTLREELEKILATKEQILKSF